MMMDCRKCILHSVNGAHLGSLADGGADERAPTPLALRSTPGMSIALYLTR
jgi:hypothetical protein